MADTGASALSSVVPGRPVPLDARVGRDAEVAELAAAWGDARGGRGRVALIAGDAGMGKTQLLCELAGRARAEGAAVIETACPIEERTPPLWPWMEISAAASGLLRDGPGEGDGPLPGQVMIAEMSAGAARPLTERDRFAVYEELVDQLREVTSQQSVLIALDDLQWADSVSLEMLRYLTPRLRSLPMLLLCAVRSEGPGHGPERMLAEYVPAFLSLRLGGLRREDLGRLVAMLTGIDPPPGRFVAMLGEHTGGNPFFVREVLRLAVSEGLLDEVMSGGRGLPVPDTVQAVLLRRVAGLSTACRDLLAALAVAGSGADLGLLETTTGRSRGEVAEALDEAIAARLIVADAGAWRFAHALVRSAVYDSLEPRERRTNHVRTARALEERDGRANQASDADLAYHWGRGLPDGEPARAAHHAGRAGLQAAALFAHAEAASHYRDALAALDLIPAAAASERLPLQIALGEALQRSGRSAEAEEGFDVALDLARAAGDAEALARAALGKAGPMEVGRPRPTARVALEEALGALGDDPGPLQSMVRSRLGLALLFTDDVDRRLPLIDEALSMARACGDVDALAAALYAGHVVMWTPDNSAERVAVAEELRDLGALPGRRELGMWGLHRLVRDFVEQGDMARVDRDIAAERRLARELHQPMWEWLVLVHRGMRELVKGRFIAAEELMDEALAAGRPIVGDLAISCYASGLFRIRFWQGRLAELETALRSGADEQPQLPWVRCAFAVALAEAGSAADAAVQLGQVAAGGLARLAVNNTAVVSWAELAHVAARLGSRDHAEAIHGLLEPLRGRCVVGPFAETCLGAVDHYLGMLEATLGREDDARRSFESAVELNRRIGARPALAQTLVELGASLAESEPERARLLLTEAASTCDELGMPAWAEKARASLSPLVSREPPAAQNRIAREGRIWRVSYGGREALVADSKGMRDLALLVASQGQEVHVLELSAATEGHIAYGGPRPGEDLHPEGPAGEVLDATARDAYRRRIAELETDLADAEDTGDGERAASARAERDALVDTLAAALGLGGRSRHHRDDAERARQAVTARIRYAIRKLAAIHPALAGHLERSVRTGRFCAYAPEAPVDWGP